jgi:hypothetical protein
MRKSFLSRFAGIVFGIAALLAVLPLASQAQDIRERTLKFTFSIAKDHPLGQGVYIFADLVKKKSGGKIKVDVFPAGVLGGAPQDLPGPARRHHRLFVDGDRAALGDRQGVHGLRLPVPVQQLAGGFRRG